MLYFIFAATAFKGHFIHLTALLTNKIKQKIKPNTLPCWPLSRLYPCTLMRCKSTTLCWSDHTTESAKREIAKGFNHKKQPPPTP